MTRFVLIIPTRNRPDALRMTLWGLAATRHQDVIFVVSDNSDPSSAAENRAIVAERLSARQHLYIRPERVLPMVAHWNFALSSAPRGEFTGFVTDRMTLVPDALAICDEVISATLPDAVSFGSKEVSRANGIDLPAWPRRVVARKVQSSDVLADFSKSKLRKDSPRFLNALVARDSLDRIQAQFGPVFGGLSPDYAFAFRFLDVASSYQHLDAPLLIDHSPQISNGMAMTRNIGSAANNDFIRRMMHEQAEEFAMGPIANETRLLHNAILREMEIARATASGPTHYPSVDAAAFHLACAWALRRSIQLFDGDSRMLQKKIESYRRAHHLPRWKSKVRRRNFAIALRHFLAHCFGGRRLLGVTRDAEKDIELLRKLLALDRPEVDFVSNY